MPADPNRFHLRLEKCAIFTLPDAAGVSIQCLGGSVWLTLDNDLRDVVLTPGKRFEGDAHRRLLVSALEPSCISVSGSQPAALPVLASRPWEWSPRRLLARGMSPA